MIKKINYFKLEKLDKKSYLHKYIYILEHMAL